ncbi:hypothetical protein ABZX92_44410 [Lentzea sp. NPDC006480]|uniref:hypothetical protein n=1 Tax=Lentzea sp. NPDC006480 TaxID=3157176 RepID=UPI0033AC3390
MPAPRQLVSWLMSPPADLADHAHRHLDELIAACPEMTILATRVPEFAAILTRRRSQDLPSWIVTTRADALPGSESYLNRLDKDRDPVAGLTVPHSNSPTEDVNTKIKLLKQAIAAEKRTSADGCSGVVGPAASRWNWAAADRMSKAWPNAWCA